MFLENVFPPIPSELIMPLAGFFSTQGSLSLAGIVVAGTLGSVLGALPLYYAGKSLGEVRLRRWCARHGHWIGVSERDLDRSRSWFQRHGAKTVLLCRLVPGVRSLISVPAGIAEMKVGLFLLYTTIGSSVWSTLLAVAGRALGARYEKVEHVIGPISTVVVVTIVISIAVRGIRQRRRARTV
jgi:membrane protein DedA with SNARE-associated domain